jgi:hypothetical protein
MNHCKDEDNKRTEKVRNIVWGDSVKDDKVAVYITNLNGLVKTTGLNVKPGIGLYEEGVLIATIEYDQNKGEYYAMPPI